MGNPFIYPKVKHTRTQTPPAFGSYRKYKPILQLEFSQQCVYCRAPDKQKGVDNFGVDHYRPTKHFPHLETEYLNLFYSCNRCNRLKRDFWPSHENARRKEFVPNPCEHKMFEHLRYQGGTVVPTSPAGTLTMELLDLNDPQSVQFRDGIIEIINNFESQITITKKTVAELNKKLSTEINRDEIVRLTALLAEAEQLITQLEGTLVKLGC